MNLSGAIQFVQIRNIYEHKQKQKAKKKKKKSKTGKGKGTEWMGRVTRQLDSLAFFNVVKEIPDV